jgi:formate dehydrogenase major subunit
MEDPRCVLQTMKRHYGRYTPEMVERVTGVPRAKFLQICELIASTSTPERAMTSLYALGWTQHSVGSQNIRGIACIQLLLGNIGIPGGGVNALRGHSNIQGLTDLGVMSHLLPGYLTLPTEAQPTLAAYLDAKTPKALRPGQLNYWSNYPKFFVSLMKAWFGAQATKENDFCFDWLPKNDKLYDVLAAFDLMHQGKMNGYFCQGFNAIGSVPDKKKVTEALSKLSYLVIIDPLATDTSTFWKPHGEFHEVDPKQIATEVFRLPSTCFAEENGSLVNSGRWLQWHFKAADPPGEAKGDEEIVAEIFVRLRDLYAREGGMFPDPILGVSWPYAIPSSPSPEELAKEYNGSALADVPDPKDATKLLARAGEQLASFAQLQRRRRAAGSSAGASRPPAIRWPGATTPIRAASESPQAGRGRGRPTAASSTTARRRRPTESRGRAGVPTCGGTARSGAAPTFPTTRPTRRPTRACRPSS